MRRTLAPASRWLRRLAGIATVGAAAAAAWPVASATTAASSHSHPPSAAGTDSVPLYTNLGTHSWRVTTRSDKAQQYFNQGLRLAWGFNHAEAIRAFAQAERLDPTCAMCAWGVAWSLGPNINAAMDSASGVLAHQAAVRAQARATAASPVERAVIAALTTRYASRLPILRASLDSAYARHMNDVATAFPEVEEVQVLAADAAMNLAPWDYWNADATPKPGTAALLQRLERVMAANPGNPGACHLYIHAVEKFFPARALPCAERLASLMPGAGHIVHMPGHIYVRVGRYADAIAANEHAVHADESYIRDQRPGVGMYTAGYYPHNYDFLAFAASMLGREQQSVEAAGKIAALIPPGMLGAPGMGYAQSHLTRHLQMKVRFGQWKAILQADEPATSLTHANALWVYARGRALAATGDVGGATLLLKRLRASAAAARHSPLRMEFNSSDAILAVAAEVLAGYIAAASHDHAAAIAHLRGAVTLEDALTYGEPPEWSIPVRQDLGAILLQAGRKEEAAAVFLEDLRRFPDNVWSASGLELATGVPATSRSTALVDAPDRYFVRREVSIRYREIGRGAPVVLLHGYTDRVEMWTAMADSLASHHRVIVPDIRGFGKSSKFARTADYGRAMFADVVALLDHLSIPRAHLVGYSMGAVLAANLAVEHPQRVISASLLAGPFWPDSAGMARDLSPHLAALKRGEGLASFFRFIVPTWPDSLVRAGAAYYYAENDSASLVASIEAFPGLMLDSARVARLRAPALAIIGADDRSLLHASDRIARWWPGARHVVLPRGDHTDIFQLPETIAEVRSMVRQPR